MIFDKHLTLRLFISYHVLDPSTKFENPLSDSDEPPLELRRTKLCPQCVLKLGWNQLNPTHNVVFNAKFKSSFECKPKQIPPLSIRGSWFKGCWFPEENVLCSNIVSTPPWLLMRPVVNYSLYSADKADIPAEISIMQISSSTYVSTHAGWTDYSFAVVALQCVTTVSSLPRWLRWLRHRPGWSIGGPGLNSGMAGRFFVRIPGAHAFTFLCGQLCPL